MFYDWWKQTNVSYCSTEVKPFTRTSLFHFKTVKKRMLKCQHPFYCTWCWTTRCYRAVCLGWRTGQSEKQSCVFLSLGVGLGHPQQLDEAVQQRHADRPQQHLKAGLHQLGQALHQAAVAAVHLVVGRDHVGNEGVVSRACLWTKTGTASDAEAQTLSISSQTSDLCWSSRGAGSDLQRLIKAGLKIIDLNQY